MNLLQTWIHTPLAKALGWTLFHFLWEGAVIAGVLLVALFICRPAAARVRYSLACLALLAMPVAFGITLAVSWPSSAAHLVIPIQPNGSGLVELGPGLAAPLPATTTLADRLAWAGPFWLAGVLAFFLYRIGSWLAAERLRRVGTVSAPQDWRDRLQALKARAGIARPVALLESCLAEVPLVIGYLKPAIVAPLGMLAGLPSDQVEAILLHELAHIRRADYIVNLFQIAIEGLLFYHPAIWWVSGVIRSERENCCDDWAALQHGDAHGYATALVTLETSPWRGPQTAMAANGSNLLRRIRRLLATPDARDLAVPMLPALVLVVSAGVALAAWAPDRTPPPQTAAKPVTAPVPPLPGKGNQLVISQIQVAQAMPSQQKKGAPTPAQLPTACFQSGPNSYCTPTSYDKWLSEDVAYIIRPEERAAFQKLQTDPEREKFIEQFWLVRDPTPGTTLNEFKVENYRRIAYSNEHFTPADGHAPGWRSQRGRTYIQYGPPDEIDDHSSDAVPYQTWKYRFIEGLGSNVELRFDIAQNGDRRPRILSPAPAGIFTSTGDFPRPLPGSHVTVQVWLNGNTTFTVPLDFSSGPFQVSATLRTAKGAPVANFEDRVPSSGKPLTSTFILMPGSYIAWVNVTDKSTNLTYGEKVEFEVKEGAPAWPVGGGRGH